MFPSRKIDSVRSLTETKVRVKEMSARPQHARHLGEEARKIGITVRCLDVDHRVKTFVRENQFSGIARNKAQTFHPMPITAEANARRIQVESRVARRLRCA